MAIATRSLAAWEMASHSLFVHVSGEYTGFAPVETADGFCISSCELAQSLTA